MCEIVCNDEVAVDQYMLRYFQGEVNKFKSIFTSVVAVAVSLSKNNSAGYVLELSVKTRQSRLNIKTSARNYLDAMSSALSLAGGKLRSSQVVYGLNKRFSTDGFGDEIIKTAV